MRKDTLAERHLNLCDYKHLTEGYKYILGLKETLLGTSPIIEKVECRDECKFRWGETYLELTDRCVQFSEILLPESIAIIGAWGCNNQYRLKRIYLPNSLKSIRRNAFQGCKSLTELFIPQQVDYIGDEVFCSCTSLVSIDVDSANEHFESVDGVLFSRGRKALHAYPAQKKDKVYQIPDTVEKIAYGAFDNNEYISQILIPAATWKICGQDSFRWCNNLCEIHVAKGSNTYKSEDGVLLTKDGRRLLFYPPQKKDKIYCIPSGIEKIDQHAFMNSKYLVTVNVPESVSEIAYGAFEGCKRLVRINISEKNQKYKSGGRHVYYKENGKLAFSVPSFRF